MAACQTTILARIELQIQRVTAWKVELHLHSVLIVLKIFRQKAMRQLEGETESNHWVALPGNLVVTITGAA
jgi:hypothetical protein